MCAHAALSDTFANKRRRDVRPLNLMALSAALCAVGAAKMIVHWRSGEMMALEGCQGSVFYVPLDTPSVHCWGCYAVALGIALPAWLFVSNWRQRHAKNGELSGRRFAGAAK